MKYNYGKWVPKYWLPNHLIQGEPALIFYKRWLELQHHQAVKESRIFRFWGLSKFHLLQMMLCHLRGVSYLAKIITGICSNTHWTQEKYFGFMLYLKNEVRIHWGNMLHQPGHKGDKLGLSTEGIYFLLQDNNSAIQDFLLKQNELCTGTERLMFRHNSCKKSLCKIFHFLIFCMYLRYLVW